jgi:hypothetical protein
MGDGTIGGPLGATNCRLEDIGGIELLGGGLRVYGEPLLER